MNNLCECGCDLEVKSSSARFLPGHHNRSPEIKEKKRLTTQKNYGSDNPFQVKEIKNKIKNTNNLLYGVDNPSQSEEVKQKKKDTLKKNYNVVVPYQSEIIRTRGKETCLKNYNVVNPSESEIIQKKKIKTCRKHFDVDYPGQSEQVKEKSIITSRKHFNTDYPMQSIEIQNKSKASMIKIYGVPYSFQSPILLEKSKKTSQKHFGTDWAMQDPVIQKKSIENSFRKKEYKLPSGKIIYLQGYEPSFLDFVFSNDLLKEDEIIYRPQRIKYLKENGSSHYYFADFFIPKFNLVIEIKSWYILSLDSITAKLKENATLDLDYKYILILDKKYEEFKLVLGKLKKEKEGV